jgi:hypothetical protein
MEIIARTKDVNSPKACTNTPEWCMFTNGLLVDRLDPVRTNVTRLPVYFAQTPAGASLQTAIHFVQLVNSKIFRKFDYGESKNKKVYNSATPPVYDMSLIKAPVYLYWGPNDILADPTDVAIIAKQLTNSLKLSYEVPAKEFTHYDFMRATDANTLVFDKLIGFMREEEKLNK